MAKYTHRLLEVDAVQWNGSNRCAVMAIFRGTNFGVSFRTYDDGSSNAYLFEKMGDHPRHEIACCSNNHGIWFVRDEETVSVLHNDEFNRRFYKTEAIRK